MRYLMGIGVVLALLMGPAFSQQKDADSETTNQKAEAEKAEEARQAQEIERKYKEVIKKTAPTTTTKVSNDPWQSVRSSASPAKSKP